MNQEFLYAIAQVSATLAGSGEPMIAIGWYANDRYDLVQLAEKTMKGELSPAKQPRNNAGRFRCDGRTHCSHMTSCAEARFFLENCPNTKMDGDHDGIPCERQWCN